MVQGQGSLAVVVQNGGAAAEWRAEVFSAGGGEQDLAAVLEVVYGCAPVRGGDISGGAGSAARSSWTGPVWKDVTGGWKWKPGSGQLMASVVITSSGDVR